MYYAKSSAILSLLIAVWGCFAGLLSVIAFNLNISEFHLAFGSFAVPFHTQISLRSPTKHYFEHNLL